MKVLLTGGGGQLGIDIIAAAKDRPDLELLPFARAELDVTNADAVRAKVQETAPQVVIHAAAYTAVDDCETNRDQAMSVNCDGTRNIVSAASEVGARVIYISTDYVFDGGKDEPYTEGDTPNPASGIRFVEACRRKARGNTRRERPNHPDLMGMWRRQRRRHGQNDHASR